MTIDVHLDKLFDHLKKISPVVISVGIVSGLILFLPEMLLQKLHLVNIPEGWLLFISILFLFSLFLTLVLIIQMIISAISKRFKRNRKVKQMKGMFMHLSNKQKEIIRELLCNDQKQVFLEMNDGNAAYLSQSGYIYRPAQQVELDAYTNGIITGFLAQPWLITAFNNDPDFFLKN